MQIKSETTVGILVLGGIIIFSYMGFKIDAFRFNVSDYSSYNMSFNDISGLTRKSDVKIAGVKVGWVEEITLTPDDVFKAKAHIKVRNEYKLYSNAYARIRQENLLGSKYLEVVPGDPTTDYLPAGGALREPKVPPVSMDDLLSRFQTIARNVETITDSLADSIGGARGKEQMQDIFNDIHSAARSIASFSQVLDKSITRNENGVDSILRIGDEVKRIADHLDNEVLPTVQNSIERIANTFDRDFDRVAGALSSTAGSIEEASIEIRNGFTNVSSITEKIDEGKGLLGKLINEDETYYDLKVAVQGLKNYFAKVDMLEIIFDAHGETMHRPAENYRHEDSKFFFDMRIHPNEHHFYVVQLATSERGYISRNEMRQDYCTIDDMPVDTNELTIADRSRLEFVYDRKNTFIQRNSLKLGLQFGKIFKDLAFRIGLFEGSGGLGVDFNIPLTSDKLRWVTSLELYDMTGWNRIDDRRPHLKWINKMYVLNNIYFVFGADDFVSKNNANAFFGAGIRFGDDDVKYLLPSFGSSAGNIGK